MLPTVLVASLLGLPLATLAAPAQDVDFSRRANSSVEMATWNNIVLFEQFSAATYCSDNYQGFDENKIICRDPLLGNATSCPLVEEADTTVLAKFANTGFSGLTGYVAHDHTHKLNIVAFRGTQNLRNYWADLQVRLVKTDLCHGCKAHEGFWNSWNSSRSLVLPAVRYATRLKPDYSLVIIGHSLGAAQATLCAADLRNQGYKASLYAYGCPRVCSPKLADHISAQPGGTFRVTHLNDPVPKLPLPIEGYQHIAPEYYINSITGADNATVANLVGPLLGVDNKLGNIAQPFLPFTFAPHEWYIGNTTMCGKHDDLPFKPRH